MRKTDPVSVVPERAAEPSTSGNKIYKHREASTQAISTGKKKRFINVTIERLICDV